MKLENLVITTFVPQEALFHKKGIESIAENNSLISGG